MKLKLIKIEGKLGGFSVVKVEKSSYELKQFSSELNLLSLSLSKCTKFKILHFKKANIKMIRKVT